MAFPTANEGDLPGKSYIDSVNERAKGQATGQAAPEGAFAMQQGDRVPGYRKLSDYQLQQVTLVKEEEERILRFLDQCAKESEVDQRWLAVGRTHLQQAAMCIIRSIAQPQRITLPEDHA